MMLKLAGTSRLARIIPPAEKSIARQGSPAMRAIPRFCGNNSPRKINRLAAVLQEFTSNGLTNSGQCE